MKIVEEWIKLSRDERTTHLNLLEPCLERGGNSEQHRGVLAQYLNTSIPSGKKIYCCHACHNGKCSNPHHLYWGTPFENNVIDSGSNGTYKHIQDRMKDKYGADYETMLIEVARKGGHATKGRKLTPEWKHKLSLSQLKNK